LLVYQVCITDLTLKKEELGPVRSFNYSGFILSIQGVWCLATAGHALKELEQHINNETIKIIKCAILDYFGPNAKSHEPVPFDYVKAPKYFIDNDKAGLDDGLIYLSRYYQGLLEANGIVPVSEKDWKNLHKIEFGIYMMIGLPQKFIKTDVKKKHEKLEIQVSMHPTAIVVDKLDEIPSNATKTKYPHFIGKIPDECLLDDIDGMSGGPILGFTKEGNKYYIVAIQSSWLPTSKTIFGCPLPLLGEFVETMVANVTFDDVEG
jgi:hypothetical protein